MNNPESTAKDNPAPWHPRPAATLILVRNDNSGLQTYLLKRSGRSKFFPGSYVFPGGVLEDGDRDFHAWKSFIDIDMEEVKRRFGGEDIAAEDALGYCVAGIRETFEEAGVLIARSGISPVWEQECLLRKQGKLERGWLYRLALSSGLVLDLNSLSRWSHWITPKLMKYHYDTLFFIAKMPARQSCTPDGRETQDGIWITPLEALERNLAGSIQLTPPTLVTMHELLNYPDTDFLKKECQSRTWGKARLPRMVQTRWGTMILEPWDPEYNSDERTEISAAAPVILSAREPFSRLLLHCGIWKSVQVN